MSWDEAFRVSTAILASLGGGVAIVLALSSYLGKLWASKILAREQLELDRLRKEHEVRFSRLHIERADAIKETAQQLQRLDDCLHSILKQLQLTGEPDIDTKLQEAHSLHNGFVELYKKHRLFFAKDTVALMHKIAMCSRSAYLHIKCYPTSPDDTEYKLIPGLFKEREEAWENARKEYYGDMQLLIEQLEAEFRGLLGIGKIIYRKVNHEEH